MRETLWKLIWCSEAHSFKDVWTKPSLSSWLICIPVYSSHTGKLSMESKTHSYIIIHNYLKKFDAKIK